PTQIMVRRLSGHRGIEILGLKNLVCSMSVRFTAAIEIARRASGRSQGAHWAATTLNSQDKSATSRAGLAAQGTIRVRNAIMSLDRAGAVSRAQGTVALIVTAALWGSNHVVARAARDIVPLPSLVFWRWGLAVLPLTFVALPSLRQAWPAIRP